MKTVLTIISFLLSLGIHAQWQPVAGHITTPWTADVDADNPHPEYPRPIMERREWMNLNGLWNYAILPKGAAEPRHFDGQILVPYPIESSLSGVGKHPTAAQELWYEREFELPNRWRRKDILLHFGAVDFKADVWVNDSLVASHNGGYTEFSANISRHLYRKGTQRIVVRVWDPTDEGTQPRGKQVNRPGGIWYTPVSGIWQTVWIEPVSLNYMESIRIIPNIDDGTVLVETHTHQPESYAEIVVSVYDGNRKIMTKRGHNNSYVLLKMPKDFKMWTPDDPFLYDLKIELKEDRMPIDQVRSYVAMRKISSEQDENGIQRLCLNHKPIFMFGPLDQGWWPDGLYTAPTDSAMLYDLQQTKALGFNMIRKHVKVEPARWYTYCDRLGLLVWQDMPNGDRSPEWQNNKFFDGKELTRTEESDTEYRNEWREILKQLESYPSITVWVPFNEAWGQYDTENMASWTRYIDSNRLVNPASGGNHYYCGDILDIHHYPEPRLTLTDPNRINVIGEYGGIGLPLEGHLWEPDRNWGYIQYKTIDEVTNQYVSYASMLTDLIPQGCSAAVYTQTTDVETEVNGLMTYDRRVIKVDKQRVHDINRYVISQLK